MGIYPKEKVVKLDVALRSQHDAKAALKEAGRNTEVILKSPDQLGDYCGLPVPYVRRYAWEAGLDPFPGPKRNNDMWLAAFAVAYLGWPTRDASAELGFTRVSIEQFMRKTGWKRYVLWGHARRKKLVMPKPFLDGKWKMIRKAPTVDGLGDVSFPYFSKRHH